MGLIALEFAAKFVFAIGAIFSLVAPQRHRDAQVIPAAEKFGVRATAMHAQVA